MLVCTLPSMRARRWSALVALLSAILAGCAALPSRAARSAAPQATPPAYPSPTLYFKADDDVIALRSGDRAVLWRDANIGAGHDSPLLAGQTLYAGSDALYALDSATGARSWRTRLDSLVSGLTLFQGPGGAALLIAVTGSSRYSSGGSGGSAYGVRASDGAILWRVKTDEDAILTPPLLSGPTAYVATDHSAYALDARSGRIVWHVTTWRSSGVAVRTAPVLANGVLYVMTGAGDIIALRASDGAALWRKALQGATASPLVVVGGAVFVSDAAGIVTTLQARTGAVLWRRKLGQLCDGPSPPPGILYTCGVRFTPNDPLFATLTAIDATTGATIWSRSPFAIAGKNPPVEVPGETALIAGTLYVGSYQYTGFPIVPPGALSALDPQTGVTLWSYPADYGAPSLPAVAA